MTKLLTCVLCVSTTFGTSGCETNSQTTPETDYLSITDTPKSPLDEYRNMFFVLDPSSGTQNAAELDLRRQELIAQCMKDAGFEYIPVLPPDTTLTPGSDPAQIRPNDRDWISQWGYGIVEFRRYAEQAFESLETWQDPNNAIMVSLSPSERREYLTALFGTPQSPGDDGDSSGSSCSEWASQQLGDRDPFYVYNQFQDLWHRIEQLPNTIASSGMLASIELDWSACMSDRGHTSLSSSTDAQDSISRKIADLGNWWIANVDNKSTAKVVFSPQFEAIRELEIELALDDFDCRVITDYNRRRSDIIHNEELRFIEDNFNDLQSLRAFVEQSS